MPARIWSSTPIQHTARRDAHPPAASGIFAAIKAGDTLLIDDGKLRLIVTETNWSALSRA